MTEESKNANGRPSGYGIASFVIALFAIAYLTLFFIQLPFPGYVEPISIVFSFVIALPFSTLGIWLGSTGMHKKREILALLGIIINGLCTLIFLVFVIFLI